MLVAKLAEVTSELDSWENGIVGEASSNYWEMIFKAENQEKLIQQIEDYFGISDNSYQHMTLNSCAQVGRIDVQLNTVGQFGETELSDKEIEKFKTGEIEAYLTTFSFFVEESKPFQLLEK